MKTFATLFAALALTAAHASAMPVANLETLATPTTEKAAFVFGNQALPSGALGVDRVDADLQRAAVEAYFDFDAILSFGVLAIAGGALALTGGALAGLVAARRRERASAAIPAVEGADWREGVLRALEQDLARFTGGLRRAA